MSSIEENLVIKNKTKGKGAMLFGGLLIAAGVLIPVGSYAYQIYDFFTNGRRPLEFVSPLIPGGIVASIGFGARTVGKIKHWYYNK